MTFWDALPASALDLADLDDVSVSGVAEGDMIYRNDSGLWVVVGGTKGDGKAPMGQADGSVAWELPASGGLGAWQSYTPTWTTVSGTPDIGNGTLAGYFKELDSTVGLLLIRFVVGSTTTFGTGSWSFSLPSGWTSDANAIQLLTGHILDDGTDNKLAVGRIFTSSTLIDEINPEGANTITSGSPMAWATNDQLNLSGFVRFT